MRRASMIAAAALVAGASLAADAAPGFERRPEVREFIRELVERDGFVERELVFLFSRARREPAILKAITPPPARQARSWSAYRSIFVNERHLQAGLSFWDANRATLERAAAQFGVPEEYIVAIIGVETFYGRNTGRWRVVDALATLAFDYPPRAPFFRSELRNYLLFARDADLDVFSVRGSYAGAIGIPQFMPGSYLRYAVDFDGDGRIDLRRNDADSIGSVANFLKEHGWRPGERVSLPARVAGGAHQPMLEAGIEPKFRLAELRQFGVETRSDLPVDTPVALIDLGAPDAPTEYRLGLRNFYVLTRYNRSSFYAAAVHDLATALRTARAK
jgi:membrane-bound lytic murein transglycosylase B